jgi:GNAT superfamily N-acetyltransferase
VDYLVRAARITDIERLVVLCATTMRPVDGPGPLVASDLLRQLVYLPQASVFVVEVKREIVGGAILALRPSVRAGGFVGTVDLLVVDPRHDADGIADVLIEELLRSAGNKGCATVEVARPADPTERSRWERRGFVEAGPLIERAVTAARVTVRQGRT